MQKNTYTFPKSSFLGMAKDTYLIIQKILDNKNVLKLLYYNTPEWETSESLNSEQIKSLFENKQISNIPKVTVSEKYNNYLIITYDDFVPNVNNTFYRNHLVEIKIICNFDNWDIDNFELRPYRIAGEIDSMLDNQKLTGIGVLNFIRAKQDVYDENFGGVTLQYLAVRGNEDSNITDTVKDM